MNRPILLLQPNYLAAFVLAAAVVILWLGWLSGGLGSGYFSTMRAGAAVLSALAFCLACHAQVAALRAVRLVQTIALTVAGTIWAGDAYAAINAAPQEWDFLCFLLDAKVAGAGLNLYDPASYHASASALGLRLTSEFQREILDVGFKYPPASIVLFLPLAPFEVSTANFIWHAMVAASIAGAGLIAAQLLRAPRRFDAVAVAATLAFCLNSAVHVQRFGQTLALLTCLVCLALVGRGGAMSGVAGAAAAIVKPFMVIPMILLLTARRWRAVLAALAIGAVFVLLSLAILGVDDWSLFLSGRTAGNIPPSSLPNPSTNRCWQYSCVRRARKEHRFSILPFSRLMR